jgi:hypothetical protein
MNARGRDFDVFAISNQPSKQPFSDRASANIASANEEDAFHNSRHRRRRTGKLKVE